ncbi:restriction endonuclease [Micromonospora zamorensis]|uniref:restriction endonuclease n=1 Tax=Micromonospora zamorensis TaxID=709883 RepID=UPI002E2006B3
MGAGLSLDSQIDELIKSKVEPRIGIAWEGRLEDWLSAVLPPGAYERYEWIHRGGMEEPEGGPGEDETVLEWTERRRAGVQSWSFPTDALRTEYLETVAQRDEVDVLSLLRLFLFEESCFGSDTEHLHQAIHLHKDLSVLDSLPMEYRNRLMMWISGSAKPHPSIRWVLDLLPHSPQQAIDAITGYLNAYRGLRPNDRSIGLLDAVAVIRARWIDDLTNRAEALFRLGPRDMEELVAALYKKLGYNIELTPPSRDGGRDVLAVREVPGQREVIEIECKTHTSPVGVEYVRCLRGVIERNRTNRGVLVAIGRFTRGAYREAAADSRIELIDGEALMQMLNANFGPLWVEDRAWICR